MKGQITCEGPLQDDTGAYYCPLNPYREEFDCEKCIEDFLHWQDLLDDLKRDRQISEEDEEEERDIWGG